MVRPVRRKKLMLARKSHGACVLCLRDDVDNESLGEKRTEEGITIHHLCALFASGLSQMENGKTTEAGLWGFSVKDISKEMKRSSRLNCTFCKLRYASIGCAVKSCRTALHLPCGREHGVLNQFFGSFSSFCREHRPIQVVPPSALISPLRKSTPSASYSALSISSPSACCPTCLSEIDIDEDDVLLTPCCRRAQIHRHCLQSQATASGVHFFRCPLCNDKDKFLSEMLIFGIYIPDRDAAWELDANAFRDQLQRHCICDVDNCMCKNGREYNELDSVWEIMLCDWCGSEGTHLHCSSLLTPTDDWVCATCTPAAEMSKSDGILSLLTDEPKESANRMKKKRVDSESHSFMVESGPSKMIDIAGPSPKYRKMKKLHGGSADSRELKVNNDKASGSTHRSTDTRNPMRRAVNRKSMEDIRNWFTSASKNHSQASYADTGRNSIVGENSAVSSKVDKDGTSLWNETVEALSTETIFKPQPRRLSRYVNVKKLRHSGRSSTASNNGMCS